MNRITGLRDSSGLWVLVGATVGGAIALVITELLEGSPVSVYTPIPVKPEEPEYPADAEEMNFSFIEPASSAPLGPVTPQSTPQISVYKATDAQRGSGKVCHHHGPEDPGINISGLHLDDSDQPATEDRLWHFKARNTAVRLGDVRVVFVVENNNKDYRGATVIKIKSGQP